MSDLADLTRFAPRDAARLGAGAVRWRRFAANRAAVAGAVFLFALTVACFVGPRFTQDPDRQNLSEPVSRPSTRHWFGTDELSRDLFARVVRGGQSSLSIAAGVAVIATGIATAVGGLAGYYRGRVDEVLMRAVDVVLVVPLLPLALALVTAHRIGPVKATSRLGVTLVLGLWIWAPLSRVVRSAVLELRSADYVESARAAGASDRRILTRHIIPNAAGPVLVGATLAVAAAILVESALSFLGFGSPPPNATWGRLLASGVPTMSVYPWLTIFPGVAIFLTVLAVNLVGDGLRDALDPTFSNRR